MERTSHYHTIKQHYPITRELISIKTISRLQKKEDTDLLPVVGCVGQKCGDVEHQLIVLVGGVERVSAGRVRCNGGELSTTGQTTHPVFETQGNTERRNRTEHVSLLTQWVSSCPENINTEKKC